MGLFKSEEEKRLIGLQNVLYGLRSRRLLKTPEQIKREGVKYVEYQTSLAKDAAGMIETADDPKTLFENVDKAKIVITRLRNAAELAPDLIPEFGETIDELENSVEEPLPDEIDCMIDKCWKTYRSQALMHNTDKLRDKQINRFFVLMNVYAAKMYPQNLEHIEQLQDRWNNYEA